MTKTKDPHTLEQMNNRNKITLVLGFTLTLIFCISIFQKRSLDNTERVIKIAYLPVIPSLPLYYAVEENLFIDKGIKVELIAFQAPNQIIDALLSGQVDFGAASSAATGITAISHTVKPNALKIFSFAGNDKTIINDILITSKTSQIQSIQDLKGKTIGVLPGIQWRTLAKELLSKHGIQEEDVTIVDVAPSMQLQAVSSNNIDALLSIEPARAIGLAKGIIRDITLQPIIDTIVPVFYPGCGVVRSTFIQEYPKRTKKIIDIFKQASEQIRKNPVKAKKYLPLYTPLTQEIAQTIDIPLLKQAEELSQSDKDSIQLFLDIFFKHGVIKRRVELSELLIEPL